MFTRVGMVLSAALFLANCSNQAAVNTYHVAESEKPVTSVLHLSRQNKARVGTTWKDHSAVNIDKPGARVLEVPSLDSQTTAVRAAAAKKTGGYTSAPILPISHPVQDSESHHVAQGSNFLEGLAKDDLENQLLKRKTIICRGC